MLRHLLFFLLLCCLLVVGSKTRPASRAAVAETGATTERHFNDGWALERDAATTTMLKHLAWQQVTHPPFTSDIPGYSLGALRAVGHLNHRETTESKRNTPGKPVQLPLHTYLSGNAVVYANVIDVQGSGVPEARPAVAYSLEGDGRLVREEVVPAKTGHEGRLGAGRKAGRTHAGDGQSRRPGGGKFYERINQSKVRPATA